MAKSASKRHKPTVVEDGINNLTDSLLPYPLLSHNQRDYVTSILSSRRKTLWTLVPKLDFDRIKFGGISSSIEEQSPNQDQLNRNRLTLAALTPNLEELDLLICPLQPFNFPSTLFNYAKSLVILKLKGNVVLNPSSLPGFPNLETLLLEDGRYANCDSKIFL